MPAIDAARVACAVSELDSAASGRLGARATAATIVPIISLAFDRVTDWWVIKAASGTVTLLSPAQRRAAGAVDLGR